MDLNMSIAAMAVNMNQMQVAERLDMSVMKMAMEDQAMMMEDMLEAIDVSDMTGIGGIIDIMA